MGPFRFVLTKSNDLSEGCKVTRPCLKYIVLDSAAELSRNFSDNCANLSSTDNQQKWSDILRRMTTLPNLNLLRVYNANCIVLIADRAARNLRDARWHLSSAGDGDRRRTVRKNRGKRMLYWAGCSGLCQTDAGGRRGTVAINHKSDGTDGNFLIKYTSHF